MNLIQRIKNHIRFLFRHNDNYVCTQFRPKDKKGICPIVLLEIKKKNTNYYSGKTTYFDFEYDGRYLHLYNKKGFHLKSYMVAEFPVYDYDKNPPKYRGYKSFDVKYDILKYVLNFYEAYINE